MARRDVRRGHGGTTGIEADKGANQRLRDLKEALNQVDSPDFFLAVHVRGMPPEQPPARRIKRDLEKWLHGLPVEAVAAQLKGGRIMSAPLYDWPGDGYRIEVRPAFVKSPKTKGKPVRSIGMDTRGGELVSTVPSIRERICKKARRYGDHLGAPYVVAVDILSHYLDRSDLPEVLFGDENTIFRRGADGRTETVTRTIPNGVWTSNRGPQYRRLSAVLVTERLDGWMIARVPVRLYLNPWAEHEYTCELLRFPQVRVVDRRLVETPGITLAEALGLPDDWPGED